MSLWAQLDLQLLFAIRKTVCNLKYSGVSRKIGLELVTDLVERFQGIAAELKVNRIAGAEK